MNPLALFGQTSNDMYAVDMSNVATNAVTLGVIAFLIGILVIAYVIVAYLLSRIFTKAGVPGWKAWIPVYSVWTTLELGNQAGWLSLLLLAPLVTDLLSFAPGADNVLVILLFISLFLSLVATVYLYIAMYKIGLHFGKEAYFILWAIFLPIVWYAWLAFDQSTWKESVVAAKLKPTTKKRNDTDSTDASV